MSVASVADVVNSRHELAKSSGWKEKPPAKAAFIKAVLEDNNVLRRPILISGKKVVVGWDEPAIKELLG